MVREVRLPLGAGDIAGCGPGNGSYEMQAESGKGPVVAHRGSEWLRAKLAKDLLVSLSRLQILDLPFRFFFF